MKKTPGILYKFVTIVLAVVLVGGLVWYYHGLDSNAQTLSDQKKSSAQFVGTESETDSGDSSDGTANAAAAKSTESLYAKLQKGDTVKIAVIGDTFGASSGASEGKEWDTQLEKILEVNYKSDVTIENDSVAVTTAFQGYCVAKQTDWSGYDMVIICFGSMDQSGELGYFQRDYESIVRALRNSNPGMVIMPMISTYVSDSNFSGTIRDIASQYNLTCVNMNNAFVDSGKDESELTTDGTYPNDDGYTLYAQAIADTIDENIKNKAEVSDASVKVQFDGVKEMNDFTFIKADDLTYESDDEYSWSGDATVLGISYEPTDDGSDSISIMVNGYTVNTIDCVTSYDLDKTHYAIGASDLTEDDTVTIVVNSDQGVTFNGITVSQ